MLSLDLSGQLELAQQKECSDRIVKAKLLGLQFYHSVILAAGVHRHFDVRGRGGGVFERQKVFGNLGNGRFIGRIVLGLLFHVDTLGHNHFLRTVAAPSLSL